MRRAWFHRGYLLAALSCFALFAMGWMIARENAIVLLPMPDPPPAGDPYWARQREKATWFFGGCCSMPLFGALGLLFTIGAIAARPGIDDVRAEEPSDRVERFQGPGRTQ